MLVEKATLAVGLIKITWYKGVNIFSEQKSLERRVKVELDLYNYATKADLKMQQVLIHRNLLKIFI